MMQRLRCLRKTKQWKSSRPQPKVFQRHLEGAASTRQWLGETPLPCFAHREMWEQRRPRQSLKLQWSRWGRLANNLQPGLLLLPKPLPHVTVDGGAIARRERLRFILRPFIEHDHDLADPAGHAFERLADAMGFGAGDDADGYGELGHLQVNSAGRTLSLPKSKSNSRLEIGKISLAPIPSWA